jgi:hypothetical protein
MSKAQRTLLLMALFCASPFILASLWYFFWPVKPAQTVGQLLQPLRPFPIMQLHHKSWAQLRGQWLLVLSWQGPCAEACRQAQFRQRQWRTAQGEHMQKLGRVWLSDAPASYPAADLYAGPTQSLGHLPQRNGDIFLVDPLGHAVMLYPATADPVKAIREINRILKNNERLSS